MHKLLIACAALAALASPVKAADLPAQFTKALTAPSTCLSAGNCSGAYWDFALENNANLGGVVSGGSSGQIGIDTGVGYQLWKGSWFAGIEANVGYQPGTGGSTATLTSTEFVKLGYSFFATAPTSVSPSAAPAASQNPFLGLVPATLLANSTPAVIAGGCFSHGVYKACAGLEIDSVIAAGWTTAFQYYNAPSVAGQADENVFRIMVQRHFN